MVSLGLQIYLYVWFLWAHHNSSGLRTEPIVWGEFKVTIRQQIVGVDTQQ